jgi:GNAT superfamily N-acetyltransferase
VRSLLREREPVDAVEAYYALHHGVDRTTLHLYPPGADRVRGYACISRTGMDLFRPLVTMRLPSDDGPDAIDLEASRRLLEEAIPADMPVILSGPASYASLLRALFTIHREDELTLFVLDRGRFEPIINVLLTRTTDYNNLPRFVIQRSVSEEATAASRVMAAAGLNWQSPHFAEIYVYTMTTHRRQGLGRSVVAAAVQHVLESGRIPLYVTSSSNLASIQLAEATGFVDLGIRRFLGEGERTAEPRSATMA